MDQNPNFPTKYSDRKAIERNRRNEMKSLYSKLCSLLPHQSSKEVGTMSEQLGEAASYIKKMQEKLEVMKRNRNSLKVRNTTSLSLSSSSSFTAAGGQKLPQLKVHADGLTLDIVLITGTEQQYALFKEAVRILIEEGADVVGASFSVTDDFVFHTIYSKIGGSGLENEAARISERLRKFVAGDH